MARRFYKTLILVEVLSEDKPLNFNNLADVHHAITDGDCSGRYDTIASDEITPEAAAQGLIAQGSDPEFFQIDKDGNDLTDEDDTP